MLNLVFAYQHSVEQFLDLGIPSFGIAQELTNKVLMPF